MRLAMTILLKSYEMEEGFYCDDYDDSWTSEIKRSFSMVTKINYSKINISRHDKLLVVSTFDSTTTTINLELIHASSMMTSSFELSH